MSNDAPDKLNQIETLAEHLKRIPKVVQGASARASGSVDEDAWQIATALADIQESTGKLFNEILPKLLNAAPDSHEAEDLLHDIGEEYRHILYHIMDTKLFSYIVPEPEDR